MESNWESGVWSEIFTGMDLVLRIATGSRITLDLSPLTNALRLFLSRRLVLDFLLLAASELTASTARSTSPSEIAGSRLCGNIGVGVTSFGRELPMWEDAFRDVGPSVNETRNRVDGMCMCPTSEKFDGKAVGGLATLMAKASVKDENPCSIVAGLTCCGLQM